MPGGSPLLDTLRARGLLSQHSEGLDAHLTKGPLTAYCGFDPTAASLHVGNLMPLMVLRRLAREGHRVVALVGGGTAMIGDPSGKSAERPLLTADEVAANGEAIGAQLKRVLRDETDSVAVVNNAEWLHGLGMIEFLRDVGKHFPVNQMLAKDTVKSRLESGISFTEFSYMLLQAFDYLQLFTRRKVTLQVGGSDQWGNITAGTELIRRSVRGEAHALTAPLLTMASGKKFGKTESGAIWLDDKRTSPFDFYQYWINADDADVMGFLRVFSDEPDDVIAELATSLQTEPQARRPQKRLAHVMTRMVHSEDAALAAEKTSEVLFSRVDYTTFDDRHFELMMVLAGRAEIVRDPGQTDQNVADLAAKAFSISKSEVRRLLSQGGLSVNGLKLSADSTSIPLSSAIRGRWFVMKRGQQKVAVVEVVQS